MKRLLLTLLCVLFAYPCFAAEPIQLARMSPWVAGSVAASTPNYCAGTELFCSTFESTTSWSATNGTSNCDGYDADGDICDQDNLTTMIGTYSVGIRGSSAYYYRANLSSADQGEFYVEFWANRNNAVASAGGLSLRTTTGNDVVKLTLSNPDKFTQVKVNDGATTITAASGAISSDTLYHVGVYFKSEELVNGTGGDDGIIRVWVNTSLTSGFSTSDLVIEDDAVNTGSYLADLLSLNGQAASEIINYDNVKVVAGEPSWTH